MLMLATPVTTLWAFPFIFLGSQVTMDFDQIDFDAGASGSVNLGTNGNISYIGGYSGGGLGTAGSFVISIGNNNGTSINIGCDTGATLTDINGNSVSLTNVEFVLGAASRTGFGAGISCQGVGNTGNFNLSVTASRTVYIGGSLNLPIAPASSGLYSTNNPGGNDIQFSVNF